MTSVGLSWRIENAGFATPSTLRFKVRSMLERIWRRLQILGPKEFSYGCAQWVSHFLPKLLRLKSLRVMFWESKKTHLLMLLREDICCELF